MIWAFKLNESHPLLGIRESRRCSSPDFGPQIRAELDRADLDRGARRSPPRASARRGSPSRQSPRRGSPSRQSSRRASLSRQSSRRASLSRPSNVGRASAISRSQQNTQNATPSPFGLRSLFAADAPNQGMADPCGATPIPDSVRRERAPRREPSLASLSRPARSFAGRCEAG